MRLAKRYPQERLEAACNRALESGACSYKSVNSILEKGLDQIPFANTVKMPAYSKHANVHFNSKLDEKRKIIFNEEIMRKYLVVADPAAYWLNCQD
jgi:hypothetical protein